MRNFNNHLEEFERFSAEYLPEEKEVLVLTYYINIGVETFYNVSKIGQEFLAYIDVSSGELKKGIGRLQWLVDEEQNKKNRLGYPYFFEGMTIYHLKVRESIDKSVPVNYYKSRGKGLMVVEVLGKAEDERLNEIKEAYLTPVTLSHDKLGKFHLNRPSSWLERNILWGEKEVEVLLEIDPEAPEIWHKALENLSFVVEYQDKFEKEWRAFSAKELITLANEWAEKGIPPISEEAFAERLEILSITIYIEKDYVIQYNSNNIFYGHQIEIGGNIEKGVEYADIWCGEGMKI